MCSSTCSRGGRVINNPAKWSWKRQNERIAEFWQMYPTTSLSGGWKTHYLQRVPLKHSNHSSRFQQIYHDRDKCVVANNLDNISTADRLIRRRHCRLLLLPREWCGVAMVARLTDCTHGRSLANVLHRLFLRIFWWKNGRKLVFYKSSKADNDFLI